MYARQVCGHAEAALSSGRASQLLTAAYGHGAKRLGELSHAMRKINNGRLWRPAARMLDSTSTGAEDPVVFNAVRLRTALQ